MKKIFIYFIAFLLSVNTAFSARNKKQKKTNAKRVASTSSNRKSNSSSGGNARRASSTSRRASSRRKVASDTVSTPTSTTSVEPQTKSYTYSEDTMNYAMKSLVLCMENKISSKLSQTNPNANDLVFSKSLSGAVSMTSEGENLGADFCNNATIQNFITSIANNITTQAQNYANKIEEQKQENSEVSSSSSEQLQQCQSELTAKTNQLTDAGKQIYYCYNLAYLLNKKKSGFLGAVSQNKTISQFKTLKPTLNESTLSFYKTDYKQTKDISEIIDDIISYYSNNSN